MLLLSRFTKMTDIVLSSFLSLFALFGKEENVDETRAKALLVDYLRHHFGIRNLESYMELYSDMRAAYEMSDNLDAKSVVAAICDNLHGEISAREEAMLLLRIMEFCKGSSPMFKLMAEKLGVSEQLLTDFEDFVNGRPTSLDRKSVV